MKSLRFNDEFRYIIRKTDTLKKVIVIEASNSTEKYEIHVGLHFMNILFNIYTNELNGYILPDEHRDRSILWDMETDLYYEVISNDQKRSYKPASVGHSNTVKENIQKNLLYVIYKPDNFNRKGIYYLIDASISSINENSDNYIMGYEELLENLADDPNAIEPKDIYDKIIVPLKGVVAQEMTAEEFTKDKEIFLKEKVYLISIIAEKDSAIQNYDSEESLTKDIETLKANIKYLIEDIEGNIASIPYSLLCSP